MKIPRSIEPIPHRNQSTDLHVTSLTRNVTEVTATREFQTDCNYNKLWSSFKLLKYLNDSFLNLIPREQIISAKMKLTLWLSFINPLAVFNNKSRLLVQSTKTLKKFSPSFFLPLMKYFGPASWNSSRDFHDLHLAIIAWIFLPVF